VPPALKESQVCSCSSRSSSSSNCSNRGSATAAVAVRTTVIVSTGHRKELITVVIISLGTTSLA